MKSFSVIMDILIPAGCGKYRSFHISVFKTTVSKKKSWWIESLKKYYQYVKNLHCRYLQIWVSLNVPFTDEHMSWQFPVDCNSKCNDPLSCITISSFGPSVSICAKYFWSDIRRSNFRIPPNISDQQFAPNLKILANLKSYFFKIWRSVFVW